MHRNGLLPELLSLLNDDLKDHLLCRWPIWARAQQLPSQARWTSWLLMGGRGSGKTRAGSEWTRGIATGDPYFTSAAVGRLALVAETYAQGREVMVEGKSGILAVHSKQERPVWTSSRRRLEWSNGAVAHVFSSADPDALRGPQFDAAWCDVFGIHPADGSGDVFFNLDPLWANPSVAAVGIDNYMPASDWRGVASQTGEGRSGHDPQMLRQLLVGGEGFDWYYASLEDRRLGVRTAITDGLNKPWVFRFKDLKSWWSNQHFDRPNGQELPQPTAWQPESKPFIFTELGCPAVNNGASQPNVFVDAKSSETAVPYFSNGGRNDLIQARFLEAHQGLWSADHPQFDGQSNPLSTVYGDRMVDFLHSQYWAWDARPYPQFPELEEIWGDAANWQTGHWLNGRLGMARLADLIGAILEASGLTDYDTTQVSGVVDGYVIANQSSVRHALDVLLSLFGIAVFEDAGTLHFRSPGYDAVHQLGAEDVVQQPDVPAIARFHEPEVELPVSVHLKHVDPVIDYQDTETSVGRTNRQSLRKQSLVAPLVAQRDVLAPVLAAWLHERWTGRQSVSFSLSNAQSHLTVGDTVALNGDDMAQPWRITRVEYSEAMTVTAKAIEHYEPQASSAAPEATHIARVLTFSKPHCLFLDLPRLPGVDDEPGSGGNYVAATLSPWSGPLAVYASPSSSGYSFRQSIDNAAFVGELISPLPGTEVHGRWDHGHRVIVHMYRGILSAQDEAMVLNGANALAVECEPGRYEIVQFRSALLSGEQQWELSTLLRGQAGTEAEARLGAPAGAKLVLINQAMVPLKNSTSLRGLAFNWLVGPVGKALDSPAYTSTTYSPGYRSLQTFAPVHLTARYADELALGWTRRDRGDADDWGPVDIPLSERQESYQVTVTSSLPGTLVRTTAEPALLLGNDDLQAAFGQIPPVLHISVAQISETLGPGPTVETTIQLQAEG